MANEFTESSSRRLAGPVGKSYRSVTGILAIDAVAGAEPDDLPASLFGLTKILGCSPIVPDSEDAVIVAAPDYTGDSLLVKAAGTNATADLTADNYALTVMGY